MIDSFIIWSATPYRSDQTAELKYQAYYYKNEAGYCCVKRKLLDKFY